MTITLDRVVLWGRPLWEYSQMFNLSKQDLDKRILDCAGGPASFNDDLTKLGGKVVSIDPAYGLPSEEIRAQIGEGLALIRRVLGENNDFYSLALYGNSVDEYCQVHLASMDDFLSDLPGGKLEGRYLVGALPVLPFKDKEFDLSLCGNLLFAYRDVFSIEFHVQSIEELCRVSREVRIFPVTRPFVRETDELEGIMETLDERGYRTERVALSYEFRKHSKEMLRVTAA
jgi:hypothetical protein